MTYWLLAFLFTPEGEMISKTPIEVGSKEECIAEAGKFASDTVNSQQMVSLFCLPDDVYRSEVLKEGDNL